jgi:K+-sensing histidine kinase KdpD
MSDLFRHEPAAAAGLGAGAAMTAAITALLVPFRSGTTRATPALALVIPVVAAAIIGGRGPSLVTAVIAAVAFNLAFIPPLWTPKIRSLDDGVALGVFVIVAAVVGTLVASEAQRRRTAEHRTAEIQSLYSRYEAVVVEREQLMEETHRLELVERVAQQRGALLRSVSHDLRTPLATIRAATSDIRAGTAYDDETRTELLDLVGDEAERLDRLVANLLGLSRIEAGALQPDKQAVALDELAADRVRRLGRLFRDVRVSIDLPPDLPLVDADYSQLDQVLTNLLENAARHAPPGSTVVISAERTDGSVNISVADEGPGVDPNESESIFEPFRRGAGSESSGVGLAICRAIVEAHGGHIAVENPPSGGALFRFSMPVRRD